MSKYFHVIVEKDSNNSEALFTDLKERELKKLFVKPYRKGKDIFIDGVIHKNDSIQKVFLIETVNPSKDELEVIKKESAEWLERVNREPGPKIISAGRGWVKEDIVEAGKNVTTNFIKSPPDNSPSFFSSFISNPWVIRIFGGLIVIFLTYLISKYFGLAL
jgi:hypothetical protein